MSDLNSFERAIVQNFLKMKEGYVLEFSNRSFEEFVVESIKVNPYDAKYDMEQATTSKANRLRGIFKHEVNYKVGILIEDLAKFRYQTEADKLTGRELDMYDQVLKLAARLKEDKIVENIEAIKEKVEEMDFSVLVKAIRNSIEKNEPEAALDRLHTYTFHFIRRLCDKHGVQYTREETLNAITGKYIKHLKQNGLIETTMTERILRSSISLLDSFNDVRNNSGLAHPNEMLNYDESLLIVNSISNNIRFIQSIERKFDVGTKAEEERKAELAREARQNIDDLPF